MKRKIRLSSASVAQSQNGVPTRAASGDSRAIASATNFLLDNADDLQTQIDAVNALIPPITAAAALLKGRVDLGAASSPVGFADLPMLGSYTAGQINNIASAVNECKAKLNALITALT